jgi:hypothetical protein
MPPMSPAPDEVEAVVTQETPVPKGSPPTILRAHAIHNMRVIDALFRTT